MADCDRGDDDGGCCFDAGGYIESLACHLALLLRPRLHPALHAGAFGEASGQDPCKPALPCYRMSGCADCDAPSGGGYGDGGCGGGACDEVSLVRFSGAALLLLFGPLRPFDPVLGLKWPLGLRGCPGSFFSWGQQTSWFSAHPWTKTELSVV